jgi:hypothetical protein
VLAGRSPDGIRDGIVGTVAVGSGDVERELVRLRTENARLLRLLGMTSEQARTPAPMQSGLFLDRPGMVTAASTPKEKVRFFRALFAAREDVYATRWENARTGKSGWVPAVAGGWRKGTNRPYLRLRDEVVAAHLSGRDHIGLYPLMPGDMCRWLAADFDGPAAMLDALAYLKAARAVGVPAALEVSRSGVGAHAWIFFTGLVPAATARTLGTGMLREAIAVRGGCSRLRTCSRRRAGSGTSLPRLYMGVRASRGQLSFSTSGRSNHTRTSGLTCRAYSVCRRPKSLGSPAESAFSRSAVLSSG